MSRFYQQELPLPPRTAREWLSGITWSYSRRQVLEQCPRRYYYQYYGSAARFAQDEPAKRDLQFLKRLDTRFECAGSVLHRVIATYFRRTRAGDEGAPWDLPQLARRMFRRVCAYSSNYPDGEDGRTNGLAPVLLREFHYRVPDARILCEEVEERLASATSAFIQGPEFERFRDAGAQTTSLVETHLRLKGLPCGIEGRIDLTFAATDYVGIVDWKLGSGEGAGDGSLQLAVYGLWARDHFSVDVSRLRAWRAYLGNRCLEAEHLNEESLVAARSRVIQDALRMAMLHNYGILGNARAFTPAPSARVCNACPFQKICPAGGLG